MIRFKQYINQRLNIFESLSSNQRDYVDSLKLDTSKGEQNFKGIIPSGQTHTEIPLKTPIQAEVDDHLANTPVTDRNGKHLGYYKRDPEDTKMAIHPDGRRVKLSGTLKSNPDLLQRYARIGSALNSKSTNVKIKDKSPQRWKASSLKDRRIFITRHPHAIFGKSQGNDGTDNDGQKDDIPWNSCNKWGSGHASDHLPDDVREGGGAAYMTHKDEPNPNNPTRAVGRIAIHPFHACDKDGNILKDKDGNPLHTILRPSSKQYGEEDAFGSFAASVRQHLEDKHPMIHSHYILNPHVYQNDEPDNVIRKKMSPDEKKEHLNKFEDKIKSGTVSEEDIQHAHDNEYLNQNHLKDITSHPNTDGFTLTEVARKSDDPEIHKAIVAHKNARTSTLDKVLEKSNDTDVHKAIVAHKNVDDFTLKNLANKSNNPEVHKMILKHKKTDLNTIKGIAAKSKDPEVHKAIVAHKKAGPHALSDVARASNDPEVHKAIVAHKNVDDLPLSTVARASNDPEVHKAIASHKNAGPYALSDVAERSDDPEVHKMILKHKKTDSQIIKGIAEKSDDPEVHKAIAAHKKATNRSLDELVNRSDDPEVYKLVAKHPNTRDDIFHPTLSRIISKSNDPEVHEALAQNKHLSDNAFKKIRHTNPGKLHKLRVQALRPPQTKKNPEFDLNKTDWFKESYSENLIRKLRGK